MNPALTTEDVARLLNVSSKTIQRKVARREIPFVRLGPRTVRFDPDKIERWLEEQTVYPNKRPVRRR